MASPIPPVVVVTYAQPTPAPARTGSVSVPHNTRPAAARPAGRPVRAMQSRRVHLQVPAAAPSPAVTRPVYKKSPGKE